MNDGSGADRDVVSDVRGVVSLDFRDVDDRPVADARLGTDLDGIDVPSDGRTVPYTEQKRMGRTQNIVAKNSIATNREEVFCEGRLMRKLISHCKFHPVPKRITPLSNIAMFTYLECSPMVTLPMTEAEGAMKLFAPGRAGATPSTETIRLEGTSRSVYFATSILAPKLSSVALLDDDSSVRISMHFFMWGKIDVRRVCWKLKQIVKAQG